MGDETLQPQHHEPPAEPETAEPPPAGDGPVPGPEDEESAEASLGAVEGDLFRLQQERDELLDTSRRLQADFENYRKRMARDQSALVERAHESLVEQLLPVLDSFELAVVNLEGATDMDKVRKGVELVYAELLGVLEKHGLERVEAPGRPFDPNEHEAVMRDEGGEGDPFVAEVLRAGWKLKGRVLRPAMVRVTHSTAGGD